MDAQAGRPARAALTADRQDAMKAEEFRRAPFEKREIGRGLKEEETIVDIPTCLFV